MARERKEEKWKSNKRERLLLPGSGKGEQTDKKNKTEKRSLTWWRERTREKVEEQQER